MDCDEISVVFSSKTDHSFCQTPARVIVGFLITKLQLKALKRNLGQRGIKLGPKVEFSSELNNPEHVLYRYIRSNQPSISARIFYSQGFYKMSRNKKFGRQNCNPELNPTRICVDVLCDLCCVDVTRSCDQSARLLVHSM